MRLSQKAIVAGLLIILVSCSTTTRFDQTCITCIKSQRLACSGDECPTTFIIDKDCIVTVTETGENLYLNKILESEKMPASQGIPVTIAKLNGKYYLTADNFANLWIIYPKKNNEACIESIPLPEEHPVNTAVFELKGGSILLSAMNLKTKYILIDDEEWKNANEAGGVQ